MGLLAPLYLLGLLGIAAPVVLHLIRKQPKANQVFSSLMFLSPSVPKVRRSSKLDHWPLLLLRALILALFAFAFARPFLPDSAFANLNTSSRYCLILIDRSASMQRQDLWSQAIEHARRTLDDLQASDEVALSLYDQTTQVVITPVESTQAAQPKANSKHLVAAEVERLSVQQPNWLATDLPQALMAALEQIQAFRDDAQHAAVTRIEIVLISDMQSGESMQRLQSIQWPADVALVIKSVKPTKSGDRTLTILDSEVPPEEQNNAPKQLRLRLTNNQTSKSTEFHTVWTNADKTIVEKVPGSYQVPVGQSRVVQIEAPQFADGSLSIVESSSDLGGTYFYHQNQIPRARIIYLSDRPMPVSFDDIGFFLDKISGQQDTTLPAVSTVNSIDLAKELEIGDVAFVVANAEPAAVTSPVLKRFMQAGGTCLLVLDRLPPNEELFQRWWSGLVAEAIELRELDVKNYLLLQDIDFTERVFAPFNNPQSNNFSGIHFWKARQIHTSAPSNWQTLARFDSGNAALLQRRIGEGRLLLLASGWQAEDSQFAVSTKFAPLIVNLSRRNDLPPPSSNWVVGKAVNPDIFKGVSAIIDPAGNSRDLNEAAVFQPDQPGFYHWQIDGRNHIAAANLNRSECDVTLIETDELERYGVQLGESISSEEIIDQARQLKNVELETKQHWWSWLLLVGLVAIGLETILPKRSKNRRVNKANLDGHTSNS